MATQKSPPAWKPYPAPEVTNGPDDRNAAQYRDVCEQFNVQSDPRYKPYGGRTFCNIYVWDCTTALGCEIPHWVTDDGAPSKPGIGHETTANELMGWLRTTGKQRGWKEVDAFEASSAVVAGHPTVAVWRNPSGQPGHVAMVLPGPSGTLHIAQAGRVCLFDAPLQAGFGSKVPTYFTHP